MQNLVAEWIHCRLFWDNITHYKTESVYFLGLMNSATKKIISWGTASWQCLGGLTVVSWLVVPSRVSWWPLAGIPGGLPVVVVVVLVALRVRADSAGGHPVIS